MNLFRLSWNSSLFWLTCFVASLLATVPGLRAQAPGLTTSSAALTLHPGDAGVALGVSLSASGQAGPFSITLQGLPSGITAHPLTLSPGSSGTLLIDASRSAGYERFPASSAVNPDIVTQTVTVVAFSGSTQTQTPLALILSLENPAFAPDSSHVNLPIVTINTSGVALVDKVTQVPGTVTITSANRQVSYLPSATSPDNTATFHLHGESTLLMPKKPYHVSLNTSTDLLASMGLQCGYVNSSGVSVCDKSKSYILLANYDDKTLLRDWAASALANAIPSGGNYLAYTPGSPTPSGTKSLTWWAPHSLFVELYLNGVYEGNYQLIEEVGIDSHRINITSMSNGAIAGNALTGGYLLEIDQHEDEDFLFATPHGIPIGLVKPDFTPEVPEQTSYIQAYVDAAENALYAPSFTDPKTGWRAYFDQASAVNFYLVNELMGNIDGGDFYSSDYFYKDLGNALLYMGPIWDFDISAGNVNYMAFTDPTTPWMQVQAPWYTRWFTDPGFQAAVDQQWNALKHAGVFDSWIASIQAEATTLEQSQVNNYSRWPMQQVRVWPNPNVADNYDDGVSALVQWLQTREAYLDSLFNQKSATVTALAVPSGTLRAGSAATFSVQVSAAQQGGSSVPSGNVTLLSNGILLGAGKLDGIGAASITTSSLVAGSASIEAIYNGDTLNGLSTSTPTIVMVAGQMVPTSANLSVSASTGAYHSTVLLTAAVLATSGTSAPSGSFTFMLNGTSLGTQPVSGLGTGTMNTPALESGNNVVQAIYNGDNANAAVTSNEAVVTISLPVLSPPVFSVAGGAYAANQVLTLSDALAGASIFYTLDGSQPSPASSLYTGAIAINSPLTVNAVAVAPNYLQSAVTSATYTFVPAFALSISTLTDVVGPGQAAAMTATVTPANGFQQQVSLSCEGLPPELSCVFSPSSFSMHGQPATSQLTITSKGLTPGLAARSRWLPTAATPLGLGLAATLILYPGKIRRSKRGVPTLFAIALIGLLAAGLSGCGGSNATQAYQVLVVGTSGGVTRSAQTSVTWAP